jgi:ribosome-binding protein aMBF1 (putative translation factor)
MDSKTVTYLRRQADLTERRMDDLLRVPAGTTAAYEDGTPISRSYAARLRHLIARLEEHGHLSEPSDLPPPVHIGKLVRAAREARGWSFAQAAAKSGQEIDDWKNIEVLPDMSCQRIRAVARALGIPISKLLGEQPIILSELPLQAD